MTNFHNLKERMNSLENENMRLRIRVKELEDEKEKIEDDKH